MIRGHGCRRVYIYISITGQKASVIFALGVEPDGCRWWKVITPGFNPMDEVDTSLRQRRRGVKDLALSGQIEVATAKVGDAVPAIRAREVEDVGIACLMPLHLLRSN